MALSIWYFVQENLKLSDCAKVELLQEYFWDTLNILHLKTYTQDPLGGGSCNTEKEVMLNHCISNKNELYYCIYIYIHTSNIIYIWFKFT